MAQKSIFNKVKHAAESAGKALRDAADEVGQLPEQIGDETQTDWNDEGEITAGVLEGIAGEAADAASEAFNKEAPNEDQEAMTDGAERDEGEDG